jgi:hypothetical protein
VIGFATIGLAPRAFEASEEAADALGDVGASGAFCCWILGHDDGWAISCWSSSA